MPDNEEAKAYQIVSDHGEDMIYLDAATPKEIWERTNELMKTHNSPIYVTQELEQLEGLSQESVGRIHAIKLLFGDWDAEDANGAAWICNPEALEKARRDQFVADMAEFCIASKKRMYREYNERRQRKELTLPK